MSQQTIKEKHRYKWYFNLHSKQHHITGQVYNMTRHLIPLIIFILFYSCENSPENKNGSSTWIRDSINTATFYKEIEKKKNSCDSIIHDSTFKGLFNAFCPNDTSSAIPFSLHKKHPFDTVITRTKDTISYSFKVSNECCVKYYGKYFLNSDTLILSYNFCGDVCDCYCDYVLTYKIPSKKFKFKHIRLKTEQVLPFNIN